MGKKIMTYSFFGLMAAALLLLPGVRAQTSPDEMEIARPSNPGDPGQAISMAGDAAAGKKIFDAKCMSCHGAEAKGGIPNPGSTDGTVPPLNPIDETMVNQDRKVFAYNIDLFIQNGSTPEGPDPAIKMPAWGTGNMLEQKQIADVIAYIISLNPIK